MVFVVAKCFFSVSSFYDNKSSIRSGGRKRDTESKKLSNLFARLIAIIMPRRIRSMPHTVCVIQVTFNDSLSRNSRDRCDHARQTAATADNCVMAQFSHMNRIETKLADETSPFNFFPSKVKRSGVNFYE